MDGGAAVRSVGHDVGPTPGSPGTGSRLPAPWTHVGHRWWYAACAAGAELTLWAGCRDRQPVLLLRIGDRAQGRWAWCIRGANRSYRREVDSPEIDRSASTSRRAQRPRGGSTVRWRSSAAVVVRNGWQIKQNEGDSMSRMRPSPAMAVAIIALIASVTSGAYAAVRITTSDIANGAVTQPKLAANSVWHANIGRRSAQNINIADRAVNNRTLSANSVWHAQIGTGSVRANNIQPQLLTELQGKSTTFASTGTNAMPQPLAAAAEKVAGGTITTTGSSQMHLLLNGFVQVRRITSNGNVTDTITCAYSVTTGSSGAPSTTGTVVLGQASTVVGREMVVPLVGDADVGPGTHTINVACSAQAPAPANYVVVGGAFTGIASS